MQRVKGFVARAREFAADESGISGIVVAIALIVLGVFGAYYVYTNNLQPTFSGASSAGGAIQSAGSTAAGDWANIK